jgi:antitoxin component of MazEF toxin-antitoxin module
MITDSMLMIFIQRVRKNGDSLIITIPADVVKLNSIKKGKYFKIRLEEVLQK